MKVLWGGEAVTATDTDEGALGGEAVTATDTDESTGPEAVADEPIGPGALAGEIDLMRSLPPLLHKKKRSKKPPVEPRSQNLLRNVQADEGAVRGEAESAANTDVPTGPGAVAGEIDLMGSLPPLLHKKKRSKKPPVEPKECKESSQNFLPNVHADEGVVAAANTDEPTGPGVVAATNTDEATGPGAVAAELAGPVGEAVAGTNTDEPTGSGAVAETNTDIERLLMLAAVASGLTGPGGDSYNHR